VLNDAGGTINNAYGLYTYLSNGSTGKVSNAYGLYLGDRDNRGAYQRWGRTVHERGRQFQHLCGLLCRKPGVGAEPGREHGSRV